MAERQPPESLPGPQQGQIVSDLETAIRLSAERAFHKKTEDTRDRQEYEALAELEEARIRAEKHRIEKDHERDERFRDAANTSLIWAFRGVVAAISVMGIIWFFHLVSPVWMQWLTEVQIGKLQHLLTGGVVTSILVKYFENRL